MLDIGEKISVNFGLILRSREKELNTDFCFRFLYIHVGSNGRISDGGVFRKTSFHRALESGGAEL